MKFAHVLRRGEGTAHCQWQPYPAHFCALGVCAAEGVEAKRVGKDPNLRPRLRTVAEATAGKTGAKWGFSPRVAADALLPRRRLVRHTGPYLHVREFFLQLGQLLCLFSIKPAD